MASIARDLLRAALSHQSCATHEFQRTRSEHNARAQHYRDGGAAPRQTVQEADQHFAPLRRGFFPAAAIVFLLAELVLPGAVIGEWRKATASTGAGRALVVVSDRPSLRFGALIAGIPWSMSPAPPSSG
jgi:hypothetical protein